MRFLFRITFIFFTFFHFLGCFVVPYDSAHTAAPDPCGFTKDIYKRSIKWDKSKFPIKLYVHESVPKNAYYNFVSSTKQWNRAWATYLEKRGVTAAPNLFKIEGEGYLFSGQPGADGFNMLFFEDHFAGYSKKKDTQAITSSSSQSGKLGDADIIVNIEHHKYYFDKSYDDYVLSLNKNSSLYRTFASTQSYSSFQRLKNSFMRMFYFVTNLFKISKHSHNHRGLDAVRIPNDSVDFPSLMNHELGHVPGLAHIPEEDEGTNRFFSVMERKLPRGRTRRRIGDYDLKNLFCGYYEYNN